MPTLQETQEYFDRHSDDLAPDFLVNKWGAIVHFLSDVSQNADVLECGGGTGLYTIPLLKRGYRVVSVDLSKSSIAVMRERAERGHVAHNLRTIHGEFRESVRRSNDKYDVVTFIKVLHHFPDFSAIREALTLAYHALKPAGRIIGFEPNGSCPLWYIRYRLFANEDAWHAEKNLFLIRRSSFEPVFRDLPGATWSFAYRYFIPGTVLKKVAVLGPLDKWLCESSLTRTFSGNICFSVNKPANL